MKYRCRLVMTAIITISIAIPNLQSEPWKRAMDLSFNIAQNSYSDSWAGGEVGSIAWVMNANGTFEKNLTAVFNFKNTTKLQFGQTHTQDEQTKNWKSPLKSADKIDIENLGRFMLKKYVDPYVAFRLESQFLDASFNPVKRMFNPMLLTESAGISRVFYTKEKNEVLSRLGFSFRELLNRVVIDTVNEETDMETSTDGGIESVTDVKFSLSDKLSYISKLSIFKAFFYSEKDKLAGTEAEDYWKAIDVNFENGISASIAKYVTATLYSQLLYDKQIDLRGRFKETLTMGISYKFF